MARMQQQEPRTRGRGTTPDQHKAAARRERRRAKRFIERHGIGELPGRRLETGESAGRQRAELLTNHGHHPVYSLMAGPDSATLDDWEQSMLAQERPYQPLTGGQELTLEQLEAKLRMAHCWSFLLPAHQELLEEHVLTGRTLEEMAADRCITKQAVHQRLAVAKADLARAIREHWNDPLDTEEL